MPDINALPSAKTTSDTNQASLLGNLPPLKGGRHHGPISDPIFLNNKKPLQPQPGLTNLHAAGQGAGANTA